MSVLGWFQRGVGEMMVARPDGTKAQVVWKHPDPTIPMKSQLTVDADERASIAAILNSEFDLNEDETRTMIEEAEQAVEETGQLYGFTRVIKDRYTPEERIGMIEMLWQVAFADGNVDMYESNLIRRVAGLIYVSDIERGRAKKRVQARLGINEGSV